MTTSNGRLIAGPVTLAGGNGPGTPAVLLGLSTDGGKRKTLMLWTHLGADYTWLASADDPTGTQYPAPPPAPITDARRLAKLP